MEPWDGPAAIAATDNEWAIVATDRNGLRPMRYTITRDKILCAGSETGMVEIDEKKIVTKGRLGLFEFKLAFHLRQFSAFNTRHFRELEC